MDVKTACTMQVGKDSLWRGPWSDLGNKSKYPLDERANCARAGRPRSREESDSSSTSERLREAKQGNSYPVGEALPLVTRQTFVDARKISGTLTWKGLTSEAAFEFNRGTDGDGGRHREAKMRGVRTGAGECDTVAGRGPGTER